MLEFNSLAMQHALDIACRARCPSGTQKVWDVLLRVA